MPCYPMGMRTVAGCCSRDDMIFALRDDILTHFLTELQWWNVWLEKYFLFKSHINNALSGQSSEKRPEHSNQCLYDWMQPLRPIYIHLTSLTIHCLAYSCNFIDTSALCWPWGDTRGCLCAVSDINNLVCWLWECMIMWMYVCTVFAVKLNCLRVH